MVQCGRWVGNRTHSFDGASFNDLAWPLTQISGSRYYSTSNNSKMVLNRAVQGVSKKSRPPNFLEYFLFGEVFLREILQICWQFISTYICQFLYIYLNISSNGVNFSTSTRCFEYWMQTLRWTSTWWESHHFQWYPDKGWKLSTGKKICSLVDHTGSAVLHKPGSGTGRSATASACVVCRC